MGKHVKSAKKHKTPYNKPKSNNDKLSTKPVSKKKKALVEQPKQIKSTDLKENKIKKSKHVDPFLNDLSEDEDDGTSVNYDDEIDAHKKSLNKLKETDPEFYTFLKDNDKNLLQFSVSDSEGEDDDEENEDKKVHKPPSTLEVGSDESDFEDDEQSGSKVGEGRRGVVTLKLLKTWRANLRTDKTVGTIRSVIEAFHAALIRVTDDENESSSASQYKVDGSAVFNGVIQLCVLDLSSAIRRFLNLKSNSKKIKPHKCKKFGKLKTLLRGYFIDLLKLLKGVTSTNILRVLLKHLHQMSVLLVSFPNISKLMVKKLIKIWGSGEEVIRVLAFLCILRITTNQMTALLETVLKSMYMTYVINSTFVSPDSLPGINFMRRSLVEMFALEPELSYKHIFVYIRQLAIHLSTATKMKNRENIQAVYNWKYINSLKLWASLLSATYGKQQQQQLQRLVYPLIQICLGVIKLVPSSEYYPLRFHLIQLLIDFSKDTNVFIPVLPFILEVLKEYDFNKKHKSVSMKPLQFTCLLRLSNSQLIQNGFKDTTIECVYNSLLEYLTYQSNSITFPDLSLSCVFQLREFCKKCKNNDYVKKMKQVLEKINENSKFVEQQLKDVSFTLTDESKIKGLEVEIRNKGTPLDKFYETWSKVNTIKKKKMATNSDKLGDYNLPTLVKRPKKDQEVKKKFENPFEGDSDDYDEAIDRHFGDYKKDGKEDEESTEMEDEDDVEKENEEDEDEDAEEQEDGEDDSNEENETQEDVIEDFYLSD